MIPSTSPPQRGAPTTGRKHGLPHSYSLPRQVTLRTIARLQAGYRDDVPAAVAAMARLRREAGREAYASPGSWGLDHFEALAEAREKRRREAELHTSGSVPLVNSSRFWTSSQQQEEREATSVHLAVTLWALHQQSVRDAPMHLPGWPLGRAVRRLAHGKTGVEDVKLAVSRAEDAQHDSTDSPGGGAADPDHVPVEQASETVRKRFVRIGASTDTEILGNRLRELVLLLRTARIPLDYGLLAEQLFLWQNDNRQDEVRRAWGREFHRRYGRYGDSSPDQEDDRTGVPDGSPEDFTILDAGD